jgi:4-alpha-glucanotransferase
MQPPDHRTPSDRAMIIKTRTFTDLLRDCGVRASYKDATGRRRRASPDALLALLKSLKLEIEKPEDAKKILAQRRQARFQRGLEPVLVAWNGFSGNATLTLPAYSLPASISYRIESGHKPITKSFSIDNLPIAKTADEGGEFLSYRLPLPRKMPMGYHQLFVEAGPHSFSSLIISSPKTAYSHSHEHDQRGRQWGGFLPLYAVRSERDWGIGDFASLRALGHWIGELGGSCFGTLPLLAAFLDEPFEISPYRPVSRLFWNELYIDIESVPELRDDTSAKQLVESDTFRARIANQRATELVDYREVMRLKREALSLLAANFFKQRPARFAELQRFLAKNPEVEHYARFRAACDNERTAWPNWSDRMRSGDLGVTNVNPTVVEYYIYAQWVAQEQLAQLQRDGDAHHFGLYLDLPIGVDPSGYDTWRYRSEYLSGSSVGSPPDIVFPKGQDWGLPPVHPERMRENGYELFRRVLSNNMQFARRLRIDHVLAFHRLYCIPPGFGAADGTYLHYRDEELYAVAILESHRNRCELVGENLGTVPETVDKQLGSHGISGMWVAPYELEPGRRIGLRPPPANDVAMLNTHDMPPFAAWWRGDDIDQRVSLGLIDADQAKQEREYRELAKEKLREWLESFDEQLPQRRQPPASPGVRESTIRDTNPAVAAETPGRAAGYEPNDNDIPLLPLLRALAASDSSFVLVNLEDLWHETCSQNVPGTCDGHSNWRRKARYRLDEFRQMPQVIEALSMINSLRPRQKEETL